MEWLVSQSQGEWKIIKEAKKAYHMQIADYDSTYQLTFLGLRCIV